MSDTLSPQQIVTTPSRPHIKTPGLLSELLGTIIFVIAVTVLFDLAIPRSLVDGRSMNPTFEDGERLVISRMNYLFGEPSRGDIIVFNSMDEREPDVMLIKRVIGLPGDTITFEDSNLYINGELQEEPYIKEICRSCTDETIVLGEDEFFMMGDNRNRSRDSRSFGPVTRDHIVGEVVFRYWPLSRFGIVLHQGYPY